MREVDLSAYSSAKPTRIKPERVDLGELPPIQRPSRHRAQSREELASRERASQTSETERNSERTEERTDNRSQFRTVGLPLRRRTKRYSFEFYDDQIVKLKQLKIRAEMEGESLSLSVMARQALDEYLRDKEI